MSLKPMPPKMTHSCTAQPTGPPDPTIDTAPVDTTSADPDPNLDLDPDPNEFTPAPEGTSGLGITSGMSGTSDATRNIVYSLEE